MTNQQTKEKEQEKFILVYEFNAPKKEVFNAFSKADALNEWWGPAETHNTVISLDFRPGGIFHYKMEAGGQTNYGRFLFSKINPHDLLEFTNAFSDEQARIVKAPFDMHLPVEIFYRIAFTEKDGKTKITLTGKPVNASQEEIDGFHSIHADMQQGFGKTFDQLAHFLAR